ncbi:MAG: T9SS type A sorting domain-containing protein [Bacteroidetes bacterium]|nr:MAG: T9SS type A sorting domain-containing protein [Bacteroidota bacterium]
MKLKTLLSLISAFAFVGAIAQPVIKNGALENWSITNYEDPSGWFTANEEQSNSGGLVTVSKVTGQNGNAIKLETKASATDTFLGYFNSTQGDPIAGQGGFPYSQKPDSITGYYQCNIGAGDSGLILIVCKKNGIVIGLDLFKFGGTQSTFKRFAFPLSLAAVPDSIIIAAASSNAIDEIGVLPGSTLTIDELAFTGTGITQAIPNGNFDNWIAKTYDVATNWERGGSGVSRTTDKYRGDYAVLMETKDLSDNGANASAITNGKFNEDQGPSGGVPFTNMQDTLVFYYKYTPVGNDSAVVFISLFNQGNSVGGNGKFLAAASSYTRVEVPFQSMTAPDTFRLEFISSKYPASISSLGSKLYIDEIQLKSQPLNTGVKQIFTSKVSAYPNPATSNITLAFGENTAFTTLTVTDALGRIVNSMAVESAIGSITVETDLMPSGVYFYQFSGTGVQAATGKFYKK